MIDCNRHILGPVGDQADCLRLTNIPACKGRNHGYRKRLRALDMAAEKTCDRPDINQVIRLTGPQVFKA